MNEFVVVLLSVLVFRRLSPSVCMHVQGGPKIGTVYVEPLNFVNY